MKTHAPINNINEKQDTLKDLLLSLSNEKKDHFKDDILKLKNNKDEMKNLSKNIKIKIDNFEFLIKKTNTNQNIEEKKIINEILLLIKIIFKKEKQNLNYQENFIEKIFLFKNNFRTNLLNVLIKENDNNKSLKGSNKNLDADNIFSLKNEILNLRKLVNYKEKLINNKKNSFLRKKISYDSKNLNFQKKIIELIQIIKLLEKKNKNESDVFFNTQIEINSETSEISNFSNLKNSNKNLNLFLQKIKNSKQTIINLKKKKFNKTDIKKINSEILKIKSDLLLKEKTINNKIKFLNYFARTHFKKNFDKFETKNIIYNYKKRFNKFNLINNKTKEFIWKFNNSKQIKNVIRCVNREKKLVNFEKDFQFSKLEFIEVKKNVIKKVKTKIENKIFSNFSVVGLKKKIDTMRKNFEELTCNNKKQIMEIKNKFLKFINKNKILFFGLKILKIKFDIDFQKTKKEELENYINKKLQKKNISKSEINSEITQLLIKKKIITSKDNQKEKISKLKLHLKKFETNQNELEKKTSIIRELKSQINEAWEDIREKQEMIDNLEEETSRMFELSQQNYSTTNEDFEKKKIEQKKNLENKIEIFENPEKEIEKLKEKIENQEFELMNLKTDIQDKSNKIINLQYKYSKNKGNFDNKFNFEKDYRKKSKNSEITSGSDMSSFDVKEQNLVINFNNENSSLIFMKGFKGGGKFQDTLCHEIGFDSNLKSLN